MRKLLLAAALVAVASPVLSSVPGNCDTRERHIEFLTGVDAARIGMGRSISRGRTDAILELYANAAGGWALLRTTPDGQTCAIAAGGDWRQIPPAVPGEGA